MDYATKELILAYLEKAENKLAVARRLLSSEDYEDSVSRSYYAAFHAAQALILTEGQKADSHKGLITLFNLFFVKTGKFSKTLGKYLTNLKDDRETSDYEVMTCIDEETARKALMEAEAFVQESKNYLKKFALFTTQ